MNRHRHAAFLPVVLAFAATIDAGPVAAEPVRAVEFYHQAFEHYFVTSDALEIAGLDEQQIPGWWRTGQRYYVDAGAGSGLAPVCRFYTAAFAHKASHFFTANAAECEAVKGNPHWTFEDVAFHAVAADAQGGCPAGTAAVHRLYNNGHGDAPNHTYTVDAAKRELLASLGWTREGTAYCVPISADAPAARLKVLAGEKWLFPMNDVDWGFISSQTTFASTVKVDGTLNNRIAQLGVPSTSAAIAHAFNVDFSGVGVFDSVSASYVVAAGYIVETHPFIGHEWTFESADGTTMAVCNYSLLRNFAAPGSSVPHPFQPTLRSGCWPGVAKRR